MIEKALKRFCSQEVCLLLERMESHPEEFYGDYSKWSWVFTAHGFTKLEQRLIFRKRRFVSHAYCRSGILQTLVDDNDRHAVFSTTGRFGMDTVKRVADKLSQDNAKRQNKLFVNRSMLAALQGTKAEAMEKLHKSLDEALAEKTRAK